MKRLILIAATLLWGIQAMMAQADSTFVGRIDNEELNIFIVMNLNEGDLTIPEQEVFGTVDGYIGSTQTSHVWAIVSSSVQGNTASLQLVNNYGSEDFEATLTSEKDGSYTLRHRGGSTLKFPIDRKWQKIPTKVTFRRQ